MSVPIVATEELGISLQKAREMVASSEAFQTAIQGGYGDAMERVFIGRQIGSPERPFAVIEGEDMTAALDAGGDMNYLRLAGEITIHLERDTDTDVDDPVTDANEFFGAVLADVKNLAAVDSTSGDFNESHLPVVNMNWGRPDENDISDWPSLGRFFMVRAVLSWGDG